MRFVKAYNHTRERFLDGPEWYYISSLERRQGKYRSPTVAFLAWSAGIYSRVFTVPGKFITPAAGLIILYSVIALDSPVRILAIFLFAVFFIDFLAGLLFRPKLHISRKVPARVRANSRFKIKYELQNKRNLTAWDIELDNYKAPHGIRWLTHAAAGALPKGEKVFAEAELEALRRGKYIIHSPIADSKFPIWLFKQSCRQRHSTDRLLVYPAFTSLTSLELPVGLKYQREGTSRVSKVGESLDFFGNREFREGDDPRHIDWPGSARTGELVVKEFQQEYMSRIALIVDTFVPGIHSFKLTLKKVDVMRELESALSLTAALTDYLTRGEFIVDIFAAGLEVYHFKAGRHLSCFDEILDILACLEPNNEHPINRLSSSVLEEVSGIGSVMLILLGWDKERKELVDRLRNYGVSIKCIVISDKNQDSAPADIRIISPGDVQKGRISKL
ncbi:DUF58 domain-containing protein [Lentisphaerota bacterium ZTH]|nr:DUF58 domain-containing protein [Lentisphaerota bacterium]WET05662.1 DUF58 domain-containing protein [Lentisphaerota bacterium ZTH]